MLLFQSVQRCFQRCLGSYGTSPCARIAAPNGVVTVPSSVMPPVWHVEQGGAADSDRMRWMASGKLGVARAARGTNAERKRECEKTDARALHGRPSKKEVRLNENAGDVDLRRPRNEALPNPVEPHIGMGREKPRQRTPPTYRWSISAGHRLIEELPGPRKVCKP